MKYLRRFLMVFSAGLFFITNAKAQVQYQRYLDKSVRWTYYFSEGGLGFSYSNFSEFTVKGDTLIGSTRYWNVWERSRSSTNGIGHNSYRPAFGMRETPDKKFYKYVYGLDQEELMNNFNLKLGDTLQQDIRYGTFRVDKIDTVVFGNEKRLFFKSIYPCGVIEGIGFVARDGTFRSSMYCFQNEQGFYGGNINNCGFSVTTAIEEPSSALKPLIYPNPTFDEITIELPQKFQAQSLDFRVYNLTGSLQRSGVLENKQSKATLSLAGFPVGIYTLLLGDTGQWLPLQVMVIR